jgi:hypothetical protein
VVNSLYHISAGISSFFGSPHFNTYKFDFLLLHGIKETLNKARLTALCSVSLTLVCCT